MCRVRLFLCSTARCCVYILAPYIIAILRWITPRDTWYVQGVRKSCVIYCTMLYVYSLTLHICDLKVNYSARHVVCAGCQNFVLFYCVMLCVYSFVCIFLFDTLHTCEHAESQKILVQCVAVCCSVLQWHRLLPHSMCRMSNSLTHLAPWNRVDISHTLHISCGYL